MQQHIGEIVQASSSIARNSADIDMELDANLTEGMPSDMVQPRVTTSRHKATLKIKTCELHAHPAQIQLEAETYIRHIKVSTAGKAKTLLADQRAGIQKAAKEHEISKDTCQAEVAA